LRNMWECFTQYISKCKQAAGRYGSLNFIDYLKMVL
jgi:hypothetical protein